MEEVYIVLFSEWLALSAPYLKVVGLSDQRDTHILSFLGIFNYIFIFV